MALSFLAAVGPCKEKLRLDLHIDIDPNKETVARPHKAIVEHPALAPR